MKYIDNDIYLTDVRYYIKDNSEYRDELYLNNYNISVEDLYDLTFALLMWYGIILV